MTHPQAAYLKTTLYCDYDHPDVIRQARVVTASLSSDRDKAVAIFYWVRDKILYRVGHWQKRASETLYEREGTCTNAANIFVAMCRAVGIPSGYGVLRVKGKKYFGPVMLPVFRHFIRDESVHIYGVVFLEGRWVRVDPSDDYAFCRATCHFNPTGQLVDWDGQSDALLHLDPADILASFWPEADIETWMKKSPKNGMGTTALLGNTYVKFLRSNRESVASCEELQPLFVKHLLKERFYLYLCWQYLRGLIFFRRIRRDSMTLFDA
ncbi:transglutaminase family protein [Desulfoluna sp.]|uniref:transglutaminase-like domain-containing protein n=1 Tax=Desulfoluna sp. TaxID=2045199 RepID=UPI00261D034B|nr:transglutaminase family protein [Desulfoluna sp.]